MKQFNLEEYLKNPKRKVVTRDGRKVRILCTDFNNPDFPVICGVEGSTNEQLCSYTKDGSYFIGESAPCDLIFAPKEHEMWINIYRDTTGVSSGAVLYDSQEEAEEIGKSYEHYVATAKVEWEE